MTTQTPNSDKQNNNDAPNPARAALRRLILVLVIALAALIYSYGWTVTEIDLDRPQEASRQEGVTNALQQLLSPRIFEQEREVRNYTVDFLMGCDTGDLPADSTPAADGGSVSIEPRCGDEGDIITFSLVNAPENLQARARWIPPEEDANERPRELVGSEREEFITNPDGTFTAQIEVPRISRGEGQVHQVKIQVSVPTGPVIFTETAEQVIEKMAQTIFMALVATTVAIPIAAFISFFAARNLMRDIRLSLGSLLLSFIAFIFGTLLGAALLTPFGAWAVKIAQGDILSIPSLGDALNPMLTDAAQNTIDLVQFIAAIGLPILVIIIGVVVFGLLQRMTEGTIKRDKRHSPRSKFLHAVTTVFMILLTLYVIGTLAGWSIAGGEFVLLRSEALVPADSAGLGGWLALAFANLIAGFGNLLIILGTLVELFMTVIAAVIMGFGLSNIVSTSVGDILRRVPTGVGYGLGAILGAVGGALVLMISAAFGSGAALLGILPPLFAGIIGGQIFMMLAWFVIPKPQKGQVVTGLQSTLYQVVTWGGFIVAAVGVFLLLNTDRAIVNGILPSATPAQFLGMEMPFNDYILQAGILGAILGGLAGGLAGVKASFPLGTVMYTASRTILNTVRSIEPLIMGLVFVVWVGIGPFAGVLALTLHSIAALGKLYSEQIENIDEGPIEALQSTGGNQLQTIIYAVVPQIVPPYIAFTMYRWDINVRMSTIIGFVGGGGIGLLLQQQINLLRYRDAGVAVLAIAIVVSVLDYASASIRERIV